MNKVLNWDKGDVLLIYENPNDIDFNSVDYLRCYVTEGELYIIGLDDDNKYYIDNYDSDNNSGDIISISDKGIYSTVFYHDTYEVDIFVTNKCNSNCIMCPLSEYVRKQTKKNYIKWLKKYIDLLPENINYLNITGGEPTLAGEDFLDIMQILKNKYNKSDFQLLTNGRSVADKSFLNKILNVSPYGIRFAIPVHSTNSSVHDEITRVPNSFKQTDIGIKNLLNNNQKVEVRIVLSKKNIDTIFETAKYIQENYKGVFCINFIAMEMMGNAAINKDELWIDYGEAFKKIKKAVDLLVESGIDVQLYNFPLCALDKGYWHIASKSITDYKIRFMDECEECEIKDICGGFFYSTKQLMKPIVQPIRN